MLDSRRFVPLLAATAAVVFVHQIADLASLLPGTDFGTPAGRVRLLIAVEARTPAALTADLLLIWAMVAGRYRTGLRAASALHFVLGALLLLATRLFLVDAGRVANTFGGSGATAFRVMVGRMLLMLALLGLGAILAGRALRLLGREWENVLPTSRFPRSD